MRGSSTIDIRTNSGDIPTVEIYINKLKSCYGLLYNVETIQKELGSLYAFGIYIISYSSSRDARDLSMKILGTVCYQYTHFICLNRMCLLLLDLRGRVGGLFLKSLEDKENQTELT